MSDESNRVQQQYKDYLEGRLTTKDLEDAYLPPHQKLLKAHTTSKAVARQNKEAPVVSREKRGESDRQLRSVEELNKLPLEMLQKAQEANLHESNFLSTNIEGKEPWRTKERDTVPVIYTGRERREVYSLSKEAVRVLKAEEEKKEKTIEELISSTKQDRLEIIKELALLRASVDKLTKEEELLGSQEIEAKLGVITQDVLSVYSSWDLSTGR